MSRRRTIVTVFGFAGVLAFGTAAMSQCSPGIDPATLPTTTTTVKPTTTTTTTVPLPDPAQEMISVGMSGVPPQYPSGGLSTGRSMSADGRYVAFESDATNLVPGDTNGLYDVFVRDRLTQTTTRVDLKSDGSQITTADIPATAQLTAAEDPVISANGRYVSFATAAQLLPSDTDQGWDVYMLDRDTGMMELLSVSATGTGSNSLHAQSGASVSDDGRYAVFDSDSPTIVTSDVDPTNNTMTDSGGHVITLFPLGRATDVFLRDRVLGTTTLLSAAPDGSGAQGFWPSITPDGRFVVFGGTGNLLAGGDETFDDVLVYATATGALEMENYDAWGNPVKATLFPSISADGNVVTFANEDPSVKVTPDTPTPTDPQWQVSHLYARNRAAQTTVLVDVNGPNMTADRSPDWSGFNLSSDGRYVSFSCRCQYVYNVSGTGHSGAYRTDLVTGIVTRLDANSAGQVGNGESGATAISADGSQVLIDSAASNLVAGDNDNTQDIFVATPLG